MGAPTVVRTPDTALVEGVQAGDPVAFAAIYDRYADRLFDLCLTVLGDRDRATVAVRYAFGRVPERLAQLADRRQLGPWLYAMAHAESLVRPPGIEPAPDEDVFGPAEQPAAPAVPGRRDPLRDLAFEAQLALSDGDCALLCLHLRHGLDTPALAAVTGTSRRRVARHLSRLRDQVQRDFGVLLVTRPNSPRCAELDGLLDGHDGTLTPTLIQQVSRHVDGCPTCTELRRAAPSPLALLAATPIVPAPPVLRRLVLGDARLDVPRVSPRRRQRVGPLLAAGLVVLAIVSSVVVIWRGAPTGPAAVTGPIPAPTFSSVPVDPSPPDVTPAAPSAGSLPTSPAAAPPLAGPATSSAAPPVESPAAAPAQPAPPPPPDPGPAASLTVVRQEITPAGIGVRGCGTDRATVSAVFSGDPMVALLVWQDPAGHAGAVPMHRVGDVWSATLGPFDSAGTVSWQLGAGETSGSTTHGPPATLPVAACAGRPG